LIEVLVAVALLAIISFLVWQAMGTSTASKERFEKRETVFRGAALALDRISRDLQTAVLYSNVEFLGVSAGGEQMTKSVFIGANNGDQDKLTFNTLSHVRYLKDTKESDLAEVSYFLEPDEDEEAPAGLFVLQKRESSPPDAEPEEGGTVTTLLRGVKELNFRYYDKRKVEYGDEWDTTKLDYVNKLPRAVEITLVLQDPIDEEESIRFSTVALLEMAPGPNDF
jgi:type II secretion system protein J